jgi:hypothetical protein
MREAFDGQPPHVCANSAVERSRWYGLCLPASLVSSSRRKQSSRLPRSALRAALTTCCSIQNRARKRSADLDTFYTDANLVRFLFHVAMYSALGHRDILAMRGPRRDSVLAGFNSLAGSEAESAVAADRPKMGAG